MITGHCLCGAVSYAAKGPVLWAGHCHCESCRRGTGAGVVSFMGVPRETVEWQGEISIYTSSKGVERGFCPTCGSSMIYRWDGWPDETHLFATTLDNPDDFQPTVHFHFAEHVDWLDVADDLPRYHASADGAEPIIQEDVK